MRYYLDTEFLEGKQDKHFFGIKYGETKPTIDLISIGIVCEDGREYYAISKDFNLKEAWNRNDLDPNHKRNYKQKDNYWIRENVLKPIFYELVSKYALLEDKAIQLRSTSGYNPPYKFDYKTLKKLISLFGKTNQEIADEIKSFTKQYSENKNEIWDKPKFYGYFSDYDWVVFCQLFGTMMDLPNGFPMYCKDLKQEMDNIVNSLLEIENKRQDFLNQKHYTFEEGLSLFKTRKNYPKQTNEHNALNDANFVKDLHYFLKRI